MPLSVAGMEAEPPVPGPSQAPGCGGLAAWAVQEEEGAGWREARGQQHLAAESSAGLEVVPEPLPPVAAVETAVQTGGLQWGRRWGAAWQAAAEVECASWRRSAQEALWKGRTAAGSASARRAVWPEGQGAFLLWVAAPAAS